MISPKIRQFIFVAIFVVIIVLGGGSVVINRNRTAVDSTLLLDGQTVTVSGRSGWIETEIWLEQGQAFSAVATGSIRTLPNRSSSMSDPDGQYADCPASFARDNCLLTGERYGVLLGRIGNGKPFVMGSSFFGTAKQSGFLSLAINDHQLAFSDNSGVYSVIISVD